MPENCDRLCLIGGLGRLYRDRLGPRFRPLVREPLGDALHGAVMLAAARFGRKELRRHG